MTKALLLAVVVGGIGPGVARAAGPLSSEPPDGYFRELKWRGVGPFRGGRTKAATGVPGRPGVFYIGAVNGGVFKSDDVGRTWSPIFDEQGTGSIGALAVAPSASNVLYVGSGEGLQRPDLSVGDGMYKSVDGGKTFQHLGLRDAQQISQIVVDPKNPDRLFVAVLGHPYGANEERGIFRSLNGGASFERVLYRDPDTGGADVLLDPSQPLTVYASLWEARQAPWENGEFSGPGSGLYKSTDGGTTWRPLGKGLPNFAQDGLGRIGLAVAPSKPRRLFATVQARQKGGLYRSDDAGENWVRITTNEQVAERADDFAEVKVDPFNPDVIFTASVVVWKSIDGGKTFTALRGAPGGDDYQRIWLDPSQPGVMLVASDQGAIVTVNGGRTWSSWYNQSTAQMFHVTADRAFPYRLCGGQQESGSACVASRGPEGVVTARDWHPVGFEEYGYAAPDPLDPDLVYGGKVTRYDRRTGQVQDVGPSPLPGGDRMIRTQPLVFSPTDPRTLYFASNALWSTRDGGRHWTRRSPDLTRATWETPASVGKYRGQESAKPTRRGVLYAIAPSPVDPKVLWVGSDDGLIHRSTDGGKSWVDVTPKALVPWAKVSTLEASHSDAQTAYAAINTLRLDDLHPHIFRTRDGGASWEEIVQGLPSGTIVNVVREDPVRKGLLFAGTEQSVFVSWDDGDHWQSLRLNLPSTSVRDITLHDDDLAIATHGRGFWILDDLEPLREYRPGLLGEALHLFKPQPALRVRWNTNTDTPLPPDEPHGPNPPDGAILDYALGEPASGSVTVTITDAQGTVVRAASSDEPQVPLADHENIPAYWMRPAARPSREPGLHRFVWDLHATPPESHDFSYPMTAVPHETPREPRGPFVLPGTYQVTVRTGTEERSQLLRVTLDPRVKVSPTALREQFNLSTRVAGALTLNTRALGAVQRALDAGPDAARKAKLTALVGGREERFEGEGAGPRPTTLLRLDGRLTQLLGLLQQADAAPTDALKLAVQRTLVEAESLSSKVHRELTPGP